VASEVISEWGHGERRLRAYNGDLEWMGLSLRLGPRTQPGVRSEAAEAMRSLVLEPKLYSTLLSALERWAKCALFGIFANGSA